MQQVRRVPLVAEFAEVTRVMQEKPRSKKDENTVLVIFFTETVYTLWRYRNQKIFEQQSTIELALIRDNLFNTTCNCNEEQIQHLISVA